MAFNIYLIVQNDLIWSDICRQHKVLSTSSRCGVCVEAGGGAAGYLCCRRNNLELNMLPNNGDDCTSSGGATGLWSCWTALIPPKQDGTLGKKRIKINKNIPLLQDNKLPFSGPRSGSILSVLSVEFNVISCILMQLMVIM